MNEKLEQLKQDFPEGAGFELEGRSFFDPSWNKGEQELVTDESVVVFSNPPETDDHLHI
jgi:hypothetical protein